MAINYEKYKKSGQSASSAPEKKSSINYDKYRKSAEVTPTPSFTQPTIDFRQSPTMQKVERTQVPTTEPKPSIIETLKSIVSRPKQVAKKALDVVGRPSEIIAEFTTPNAPLIERNEQGQQVPGQNARQAFLERTGQRPAEGFAEKAFGTVVAPFFVPGAGLGTAKELYQAAGPIASKMTSRIASPLGQRVASEALKEGAVGATIGVGQEFAQGSGNVKDAAVSGALGGALGAVAGTAGPLIGAGAKKVAESAIERFLGPVLNNVAKRGKTPVEEAFESISKSGKIPNRLTPVGNEGQLDRVMSQVKPVVEQRMSVPYENPTELAKYVQQGLKNQGADISLNEVRKVSYDGLVEMADEIKRTASTYDEAVKAARELGYDLPRLLEGNTPSIRQRVASDASERAYGVYPEKLPKVVEPLGISPKPELKEHWFTKLFGQQGVGITAGRNSGKELIDTHVVSNPKEKGAFLERAGEIVDVAKQDHIDRFVPFKNIDQDTYDAAMDSTRANNLANITIKDKFVDLEGNVIGGSLKDVYSLVPRGMKNIADRYTIARDAVNRMDRGQQVYGKEAWFPKTSEEVAQLVTKLEAQNPWLKQFGESWNQFNRNRQDLWVESGIASKKLIDTLRFTNPNYAPMFRQQQRNGLTRQLALNTSKAGFSGQKAPIKRAVGSSRKIIEPAQGMIETTASSYNAMMRNRSLQKMYEAVEANPERFKGVLEIVEESADAKQATLKAINDAIEDNGPDGIAAMLNDEVDNIFKRAKQSNKLGDSVVTVMLKGEPVKMRVLDPSLLKAIDGITPVQLEGFMKLADIISRGIKISATGLLAPLQGARLAFRDLPIAAAQSKDKLRFLGDISHAMVSQIGDWLPSFVPGSKGLGRLARDYYRAGGGYEAYLKGDSRIRSAARDITRDPLLSGRNILKQTVKYNPLRPLKEVGDAMENIPRIAAYAAEMRRTGWDRAPDNVRKALDAGREATVNWSRRGAKTQGIEAVAPYTNAAIQGTYRIVKRFKEQPIAATALIASVAGAKIAAYEKFKNDPDYQQRSKFDKGIPVAKNKDGKFVSIPVEPTEAYIADQVLHFYKWAMDQEKLPNAKENTQSGLEAFLPSVLSGPVSAFTTKGKPVALKEAVSKTTGGTVLDPLVAIGTGKNYFGGDIVPREYQGQPTSIQYNETTSAAGKWAAEHLGIDAFTFDYLANKFGGDIAKVGLPLNSEVGKGDVKGNLIDQVNARIRLLEDPVMKNNISDDYYKYAQAVSDTKAISDKKGTPLPTWYQEAYDDVTSMKKGSINKIVSDLNVKKKEITRNVLLTAKTRSDQLRDVQREINMMRIQGIKRLEELGVKR